MLVKSGINDEPYQYCIPTGRVLLVSSFSTNMPSLTGREDSISRLNSYNFLKYLKYSQYPKQFFWQDKHDLQDFNFIILSIL
jgi:hypothetical protein